jgi:tetratricopeptide (TPR) repeat protein
MKTERRHELARNVLADWLGERIEALKPYSAAVSATTIAVLVVVFATVLWYQKRAAGTAQAWTSYFTALDEQNQNPDTARNDLVKLSEDHPQTSAGLWSRLTLADMQLAKGLEGLFQDRAAARKALEEAIDDYRAVLDNAPSDSLLAERASFGLAEAYESKDDLENARKQYRELLARWPNGAFSALAQQRLADLERKSTKEFYDWFAKQSPKPKPSIGPGIPGEKPGFDLNKLPDQIFEPGTRFGDKKPSSKTKPEAESEDTSDAPKADATKADSAPSDETPAEKP